MKIVFIQPNTGFKGHTWEALGIGYITSYLKKHYNKKLNIEFYSGFYDSDKTIINACEKADIIGFSCTSPQYKHGVSLARQLKSKNNTIIFGGVHASALPELVSKEKYIDTIIKGEGEKALLQIVKDVDNEVKLPKIYCFNYIQNLDELPFPDRKTIKNERNIQQAYKDNNVRITSILSSRGCPFNCSFCCSHSVWKNIPRMRSIENILDEFEYLVNTWKIDFVKFADDTFTISKKRTIDFCDLKIEKGIDIPYGANAHVNNIDEEVLKKLAESNCQELWYGVESGSPKILRDIHKSTNIEKIKKVFKLTRDYGIKTRAYFLLGIPNETIEDINLTEKLCDEIQPDIVGFTLLAPYPTNEYFDYESMKSWDWSTVDEYNNNWVKSKTLSNKQLRNIQKKLITKYQNHITFRQKR